MCVCVRMCDICLLSASEWCVCVCVFRCEMNALEQDTALNAHEEIYVTLGMAIGHCPV